MNKQVLTIIKWLNDSDSVTQDELIATRKEADIAARPDMALQASADAANYACIADELMDYYADQSKPVKNNVKVWIDKYFELSGESKQDYIDELEEK